MLPKQDNRYEKCIPKFALRLGKEDVAEVVLPRFVWASADNGGG